MKKNTLWSVSVLAAAALCVTGAIAQVPADSPYRTDLQSTNNKDESAEALRIISIVSCYVQNMAPELAYNVVGTKPYVALVDVNKCDPGSFTSVESGSAGAAKRYDTAVVQATVTPAGVLENKIWLSGKNDDGTIMRTWVNARVVAGPAKVPPFGDWEVNWCDDFDAATSKCTGGLGHAKVDASGSRAYSQWFEGQWQGEQSVVGTVSTDEKSGGGKFSILQKENGRVNRNSTGFYGFAPGLMYANVTNAQTNQSAEQCLIPKSDAPGAKVAAWETWLYDSATGKRVDTNSGFSIRDSDGNWGFAGHWGVSVGSRSIRNGETFNRVNSSGESQGSYTAVVSNGKLKKITVSTGGLNDLAGIPLRGSMPKSLLVNGASSSQWVGIQYKWDASSQRFVVSAYDECANGDCVSQTLSPARQFSLQTLAGDPQQVQGGLNQNNLWAWQEGTSNNYNIILAQWENSNNNWQRVVYDAATVRVKVRKETTVEPGDTTVPSSLSCVGACADASLNYTRDGQVLANNVRTYTWDATAGMLKLGNTAIDFSSTDSNSTYHSGVLVSSQDLQRLSCQVWDGSQNAAGYCEWNADNNLSSYYRWESGSNSWNRYTGLRDASGNIARFDPPLNVTYSVPANDQSAYAGKTVSMQYPGSGNLWIPGYCVNPDTGNRAKCGSDTEWVNEFSIPFDENVGFVTTADNKRYLVKTLRRGVYFPQTNLNSCSALSTTAQSFANQTLPTLADWKNPADPSLPSYIGTWLDATEKPLVIDGQLQQ